MFGYSTYLEFNKYISSLKSIVYPPIIAKGLRLTALLFLFGWLTFHLPTEFVPSSIAALEMKFPFESIV